MTGRRAAIAGAPGDCGAGLVADTRFMPEKNQENLLVERRDRVAVITVSRPDKLNALNGATLRQMDAALDALGGDAEIGGVVITGAGTKAFVAGADIAELPAGDVVGGMTLARRGQAVFDRIERLGKPVVAAMNGFALGGGLRARAGLSRPGSFGERALRGARSQARPDVRLRWHPAVAAPRRTRAGARDAAHRRGRSTPRRRFASASSTASSPRRRSFRMRSLSSAR